LETGVIPLNYTPKNNSLKHHNIKTQEQRTIFVFMLSCFNEKLLCFLMRRVLAAEFAVLFQFQFFLDFFLIAGRPISDVFALGAF